MTLPRLFLVCPEGDAVHLRACLEAACEAGDVASLLVPPSLAGDLASLAQSIGVAVLTTGDPRNAARLGLDGIHVEATAEAVADARRSLGKDRVVGAFAGGSRHFAMAAAEAGADYIALSQSAPTVGHEPIVKWWSEFFEIPCVAFDATEPETLDILLPQKPDFIRPSDAIWESPERCRRILAQFMKAIART